MDSSQERKEPKRATPVAPFPSKLGVEKGWLPTSPIATDIMGRPTVSVEEARDLAVLGRLIKGKGH